MAAPTAKDRSRAEALKRLGDTEMESLRYAEALSHYEEAFSLSADPALLYNRARVLQALERFVEALEQLDRFAREAPPEIKARVPKLKELREELNSRIASLAITCNVAGARIIVRDKVVATTPTAAPIRLNAGKATLEVAADGYQPYTSEIELPRAGTSTVDVTLVPRDTRGQLFVASTPDGAIISIDGRPFGHAPAEAQLAPGNHVIVVSHSGFVDREVSAVVVEGQRKELQIKLEKAPPITSRWWFWTGIGVVVTGVAITTVAIASTTDKSAGRGDIAPGQVAGPLVTF